MAKTPDDDSQNRRQGDNEPWYSDHRIPLGLILAFLLQGGSVIWFTSGLNSKVVELDRRTSAQESVLAGPNGLSERLTRLEEKQISAQKSLDRIETIVTTPTSSDGKRH